MTIPEEEEENPVDQFRKEVRTKLFKDAGMIQGNVGNTSLSSVNHQRSPVSGENSMFSHKIRESDDQVAMKINFITLDGDELTIKIPDLDLDPVFPIMAFAIENSIGDLALIEVLRRKAQREITRLKGNYNKKYTAEKKKVAGDITPTMSTSTLQSVYRQPQETFQDYMFAKKNSFPVALPKPVSPKGAKAPSKTSKVNISLNSTSSSSALANLKNVFENKRKSEAFLSSSISGNLNLSTKEFERKYDKTIAAQRSPMIQKSESVAEHMTSGNKRKKEIPKSIERPFSGSYAQPSPVKSPEPSFTIAPSISKLPISEANEEGIPEVSYTLNIKKRSPAEPLKTIIAPPQMQEKPKDLYGETIRGIFAILDSNREGLLTGGNLDMGALMDTSIDLLDAMQDVISDIFDSSGVDLEVFTRLVEKNCDLQRLTDVYLRAKSALK